MDTDGKLRAKGMQVRQTGKRMIEGVEWTSTWMHGCTSKEEEEEER